MKRTATTRGAAAIAARRAKSPDVDAAAALTSKFHQGKAELITDSEDSLAFRRTFAHLGALQELHVDTLRGKRVKIVFREKVRPRVDCSPDGRSLYFFGGDQKVDIRAFGLPEESSRDAVFLGLCRRIVYDTRKGFHNFEPTLYGHWFGKTDRRPDLLKRWQTELGRSAGRFPALTYDVLNGRLSLSGGAYVVHREGIVY